MTDLSQRLSQEQELDTTHLEMRKNNIRARRYRVYSFVLFVIIVLVQPYVVTTTEEVRGEGSFAFSLSAPFDSFTRLGAGGKMNELSTIEQDIEKTQQEINIANIQIEIVKNLETPEKRNTILNCVNWQLCEEIDEQLITRIDLLRSFIMIEGLKANKLAFDQKFVLRNITEFLTWDPGRGQLIDLNNITFGDKVEVIPEYKLFKVPITLDVTYQVNNDFMKFLHNLETKVSPNLPVMRRVNAMNYDIVNYLDSQDVSMSAEIYFIEKENSLTQLTESNTGDQIAEDLAKEQHASAELIE